MLVIASVFWAPLAGTLAIWVGATEPPLIFSTAMELPRATNEYLPSGVTTTPNGLPPRGTVSVRACEIG